LDQSVARTELPLLPEVVLLRRAGDRSARAYAGQLSGGSPYLAVPSLESGRVRSGPFELGREVRAWIITAYSYGPRLRSCCGSTMPRGNGTMRRRRQL